MVSAADVWVRRWVFCSMLNAKWKFSFETRSPVVGLSGRRQFALTTLGITFGQTFLIGLSLEPRSDV